MTLLYCWKRTRVQIRILKPNGYIAEHVQMAQTKTWIPTPYFCIGQESVAVSISESVCGNVNEP